MLINLKPYLYIKGADSQKDAEFAGAQKYGKVRLGNTHLFWRSGLKQYAIALHTVQRIHRRINPVVGRLCAGGKNYDMEYLVMIFPDNSELVIHIADDNKRAAESLMAALQESHPELKYGKE